MKKLISMILIAVVCIAFVGCAAKGGSHYDNVANSQLTASGLNNLRQVVSKEWDYAFVAGDCIFTDDGYYRFEDVLEYNLSNDGFEFGEKEERAVFFARGEECVYGVYRSEYKNGYGSFYAFSASYENPSVEWAYIGRYPYEEAFVGQGGSEDGRLILIGKELIAFNYKTMNRLATQEIGNADAWDFEYFQRGNTAVVFNGGDTVLYTYDKALNKFSKWSIEGDYSLSESPAEIDGFYFFGGDRIEIVKVGDVEEGAESAALERYEAMLLEASGDYVSDGVYSATLSNGTVTATDGQGLERTVSVQAIIDGVPAVSACVQARDGLMPEITSVKIVDGEIFILLEREPDVFAGLRDVNDGIPQIVVRLDLESGDLTFCGLVDFTGYSIYRIVKL